MPRNGFTRRWAGRLLTTAVALLAAGAPVPATPAGDPVPDLASARRTAQPVAFVYAEDTDAARAYAAPGGMVVAGRDNYAAPAFRDVAAGGGTVLAYLAPTILQPYGRYHAMLFESSGCGPAVPAWPGDPANEWGTLSDLRAGGLLDDKLSCVLETMVEENPHMAGWFVDELGSRPWGMGWESWSAGEKREYYDGAVALASTFREVADRHGLLVLVNGTWNGGSVTTTGGGYPDVTRHGNALADGGTVEHHDGQEEYFASYACDGQWAEESETTGGIPVMVSINESDDGRDRYSDTGCFAYTVTQTDYGTTPEPWTGFHHNGLPSGRVTG